jgi:glycosyltransferase involved in cell wall biosynthesis
MACGKLLLCSDIDPAREVVEDRVNGMLFRLGDVDDLAGKTLLAAGDPSLRNRIGDAARQQAARFGLQRAVSAYERLLLRLADSRAA